MTEWDNWGLLNFFYLFIGLAFVLIWIQVVLFHWRGAFRHRVMWAPVVEAPLLAAMGIVYSFVHGGILDWLFVLIFAIGTFGGLGGTYYHFRGVKNYIGGFSLRNFMVGPPVIIPMIFMAMSLSMLIVYFAWGLGK